MLSMFACFRTQQSRHMSRDTSHYQCALNSRQGYVNGSDAAYVFMFTEALGVVCCLLVAHLLAAWSRQRQLSTSHPWLRSCSRSYKVALEEFSDFNSGKKSVVFVIKVVSGRNIAMWSAVSDEAEVLMCPGSRLVVTRHRLSPLPVHRGRVTEIHMVEVRDKIVKA